jgi:hypothetical protein
MITLSEIIRGSPTSCCFLQSRKLALTKLWSVASGWAGSCVTTTAPRELAAKSRSIAMRLWLGRPRAETNASLMATTTSELTSWLL